jgi:hypothetical protein
VDVKDIPKKQQAQQAGTRIKKGWEVESSKEE